MIVKVSLGGKASAAQFEKASNVKVSLPQGGFLEIQEDKSLKETRVLHHDGQTTECVWSQVDA